MVTFDIAGFFDNIAHGPLIQQLRHLRVPSPIVLWVESFLSDRRTTVSLDGRKETEEHPLDTGIPQGSLVSPVLATVMTCGLGEAIKTKTTNYTPPPKTSSSYSTAKTFLAPSTIYVDNGNIIASATNLKDSTLMAGKAREAADTWLHNMGLSTAQSKDAAIHFHRSPKPPHPLPTIKYTNHLGVKTSIIPSQTLKWLGVTFDPKLTFDTHVEIKATKAKKSISAIAFLGNSIRGIDQKFQRLLYLGGIRPILTYASTTWWNNRSSHLHILNPVQNLALRKITGGFRTSPTYALENEASIPPIEHVLDYLRATAATRLSRCQPSHPVVMRLPSNPLLEPPHLRHPFTPIRRPYKTP